MATMAVPIFLEAAENYGFDAGQRPPWQMVGLSEIKVVHLSDGSGWNIRPEDPLTASITEDLALTSASTRSFDIKGEKKGITHILGDPAGGGPSIKLLEVEVKEKTHLSIAFNFVEDSHYEKTTRPASAANFMTQLKHNLNEIFERQTNLTLDVRREQTIHIPTSLRDIIGKRDRFDLAHSGSFNGPLKEWFKMTKEGDASSAVNIFFVPRSIIKRENDFDPLLVGIDGDVLVEDDPFPRTEKLERDLAHYIAQIHSCQPTNDSRKTLHLLRRTNNAAARFIPKVCANLINPTFW